MLTFTADLHSDDDVILTFACPAHATVDVDTTNALDLDSTIAAVRATFASLFADATIDVTVSPVDDEPELMTVTVNA